MEQRAIDEALYKKYIEPTKNKKERFIGIEIEMPVVNLNKKPVDEKVIFELGAEFMRRFDFKPVGKDSDGNINSMISDKNGDDLSFDCSYSNLELSLGKCETLHDAKNRFETYYSFINKFLSRYNYTLTGMGINPYYKINKNEPIKNERYRMLYHYLHTYKKYPKHSVKFHDFPKFGTFTSASQVQIDVFYDELTDVINVFGLLEPYKAMLFSNSYLPEVPQLMCARNMLWEHSMQGYNPHNIGMFGCELKSAPELLDYIKTTSVYCTMRDGKYVNFTPVTIEKYLNSDAVNGEYFDGEQYRDITITPKLSDIEYLRTFKFEDLTFRGTIEFRSSCCQPIADSMCVAAFHLGLMNKIDELKQLMESDDVIYHHGYSADELQKMFSMREFPDIAEKSAVSERLEKILDLAASGLKIRDENEEIFLAPLYERAKSLTNPARRMVEGMENGRDIEYYIDKYSRVGEVI